MGKDRIPVARGHERIDRLEPDWHELADAGEALKLKRRQDARSEAWRGNGEAEVAHPEEYEGVLLVGGRRYSVRGSFRAEPGAGSRADELIALGRAQARFPKLRDLALTEGRAKQPIADQDGPLPEGAVDSSRPKTAAERMRDYRARKKREKAMESK